VYLGAPYAFINKIFLIIKKKKGDQWIPHSSYTYITTQLPLYDTYASCHVSRSFLMLLSTQKTTSASEP
jgi:hypothetical protein